MSLSEDEVLGKAYDGRLMRRLLAYLRPYRALAAFALVAIIAGSALQLVPPYLMKIAIDRNIATGDLAGLDTIGVLFLLVILGSFVCEYTQTYITQTIGQRIMFDMRMQIYSHLQRLDLRFYDRNPVGRLMTRVTTDVDVLNDLFTSGVITVFGDVFLLAGIMITMLAMNWELALVTFAVLPLIVLVTQWFRRNVRDSYRTVRTWIARINAYLQEHISGMSTVQLFRREARDYARFDDINRGHRDANIASIFYYAVFYPAIEIIGALATSVIIWYGGGRVIQHLLTLGSLVAFVQYSQRFYRPISDISEKFNLLQAAMASSERIFKLLDTPVVIQSPAAPRVAEPFVLRQAQDERKGAAPVSPSAGEPFVLRQAQDERKGAAPVSPSVAEPFVLRQAQDERKGAAPVSRSAAEPFVLRQAQDERKGAPAPRTVGAVEGTMPGPIPVRPEPVEGRTEAPTAAHRPGHIAFDHVWFAYNGEDYVLRDVSFEVRPGERVAIVGATGAGKSTIVNLLLRFYDVSQGRILVDGADIRQMDLGDLRKLFSLVLQDVQLFSGTIATNIRLGNEAITDEQVRAAAEAVHANAFVERLPQQFDTAVAERGATLSVGQKQLLSFARALAFDPQVLVLDEATSSVDTETELLIRDALQVLMSGRTTVAIAHRLSTIQDMDKILVLHKGELREAGTHQQLLAQRGIYYRLYQLQYKDQEVRSSVDSRR